jgi:hypothetical protein
MTTPVEGAPCSTTAWTVARQHQLHELS